MTGSTHAHHRSARSPGPTPEGRARENPIVGPRTDETPCEPSAHASAGASGRHNEPGSRPASACPAQPPSKAGGASPWGGERRHDVGKADRSTESDWTGRGAAHNAGPPGTPERHAAGHNWGTRTGAKQQRPPGAANCNPTIPCVYLLMLILITATIPDLLQRSIERQSTGTQRIRYSRHYCTALPEYA